MPCKIRSALHEKSLLRAISFYLRLRIFKRWNCSVFNLMFGKGSEAVVIYHPVDGVDPKG